MKKIIAINASPRAEMNNQCRKANCPFYNNGKAKTVTVVAKKRPQK